MRVVEEGVVVVADEEDPEVEAEAVVEAVGEVDAWIKSLYNDNWKSC